MKSLLFGIAVIAGMLATPALAADMPVKAPPPPPPMPTWTGCYLGINGGGDWARWRDTWTGITEAPTGFAVGAATVLPAAANATLDSSSVLLGGQIGCNNQTGSFVLGVEGDLDWDNLHVTRSTVSASLPTIVPGIISEQFSSNALSTLRLRAGLANGPWLVYVTGGGAVASMRSLDQVCFPTAAVPTCNTATSRDVVGAAAGGGVEWMVSPGWSLKAEYLYVDFFRTTIQSIATTATGATPNPLGTINHNHDFGENVVRVGLNYHFNMPLAAKY